MGGKDIPKLIRESTERPDTLAGVVSGGLPVGVDISTVLHRALSMKSPASEFHRQPMVPVAGVAKHLAKIVNVLRANGLEPLMVFDGANHPMKAGEDKKRAAARAVALKARNALLERRPTRAQDLAEVQREGQKCTYMRQDVIKLAVDWCVKNEVAYMGAPLEAEWQLVSLEREGYICGIVTIDSDVLALGGKIIIDLVMWTGKGPCKIIQRDEVLKREELGGGEWADYLPELFAFLGCDYIQRLWGNGPTKVKVIMKDYIGKSATERKKLLREYQKDGAWPKKSNAAGFASLFSHTCNLFRRAPIFVITPIQGTAKVDAILAGEFTVSLGALSGVVAAGGRKQWAKDIGFDPVAAIGVGQGKYVDAAKMKINLRGAGAAFTDLPLPQNEDGDDLRWGSELDFDAVPVQLQDQEALNAWCHSRACPLTTRDDTSRAFIEARVGRIRGQGERGPKPLLYTDGATMDYLDIETIAGPPGGGPLLWQGAEAALAAIRSNVESLDARRVSEIFGRNNGIRHRADLRLKSGHNNPGTLRYAHGILRHCKTPVMLFQIKCTPSMKADDYWVTLVFKRTGGGFVPTPSSRCQCPVGRYFCSHMLSFIAMLYVIQQRPAWTTAATLEANMPPPIKSIQSLPIPMEYVFSGDGEVSGAGAELGGALGHGHAGEGDDGNVEDEEVERLAQDEVEEGGVLIDVCAAALTMVEEAEKRGGSEGVEQKYTVSKIAAAARKAKLEGPNETPGSKLLQLELLERLDMQVKEGKLPRSQLSHYAAATRVARARQLDQLSQLGKGLKRSREEDAEEEGGERGFAWGEVFEKEEQVEERHARTRGARGSARVANKRARRVRFVLERPPCRLAKICSKYCVLCDRGFANTAMLHPNVNPQICPSFLRGRAQFDAGEITQDRRRCEVRYGSETNFSRVTDTTYLADVVPRSKFKHMPHTMAWAHGRANLYRPFYNPPGTYFEDGGHEVETADAVRGKFLANYYIDSHTDAVSGTHTVSPPPPTHTHPSVSVQRRSKTMSMSRTHSRSLKMV